MSEYSRYVKSIWFGVEGPGPEFPMLGIIKRSGRVQQTGHFCHVQIPVNGKKVWAGGAEDRTFYMHLVRWEDIGRKVPKDMIPALGWTVDGNHYAFSDNGNIVEAGSGGTLHPIDVGICQLDWLGEAYRKTLVQRGFTRPMGGQYGQYVALMREPTVLMKPAWTARKEKPWVILPRGCFSFTHQEFYGLTGPLAIWNGQIPSWCKQVLEVKCDNGWIHTGPEHLTILYQST